MDFLQHLPQAGPHVTYLQILQLELLRIKELQLAFQH